MHTIKFSPLVQNKSNPFAELFWQLIWSLEVILIKKYYNEEYNRKDVFCYFMGRRLVRHTADKALYAVHDCLRFHMFPRFFDKFCESLY